MGSQTLPASDPAETGAAVKIPATVAGGRKAATVFWLVSLFKVFILQAIFLWDHFAGACKWGQLSPQPDHFTGLDMVGLGFLGRGVFSLRPSATAKLARFKANPAHQGTRHGSGTLGPIHAIRIISAKPCCGGGYSWLDWATPSSGWTVISPIIITVVFIENDRCHIDGKKRSSTRDRATANTSPETPVFFSPGFPKKMSRLAHCGGWLSVAPVCPGSEFMI